MITRRQLLILVIVTILVVLAIPKHAALNTSTGTIASVDEHHLIVSRSINGKTERLRFTVTSETVRSDNLSSGVRVTVHYLTRNHENIATSVQSLPRP
jgi:hypothetical protein